MRRKTRRRVFFLILLLLVFYGVMYRGIPEGSSVDPVLVDGVTHFVKRCSFVAFRLNTTVEVGGPQETYDQASALACPAHL